MKHKKMGKRKGFIGTVISDKMQKTIIVRITHMSKHPKYGKIKMVNNPIKLSKIPARIKMKAPELGEHTESILKELGYSDEAIAEMKESGVIG